MDDDGICEVVITGPESEWMTEFPVALVQERLCAAAHVLPIRTVYRWQGSVRDERELRITLHTRTSLVAQIVERTEREHPYELPGIVAIPLTDGSPRYLEWVASETANPVR